MEDQDLHVDPNYQKGFNGGYILAEHEPELLSQLVKSDNADNQLFNGIKAGGKEFFKEKFREELNNDKNKLDKSKDLDRDIEL
jgi:hypothetical protein